METTRIATVRQSIFVLIAIYVITALATIYFERQRIEEPIVKGPGVTRTGRLSDYFPPLKKYPAVDTVLYFLEGEEPGGTMAILGGTHPGEPNAMLVATLFIERARVKKGRLIITNRLNRSGYDVTEPGGGYPPRYHISQLNGNSRWFRMGGRTFAPFVAWPDPTIYVHYPEGQSLASGENLNLNRNYPGRPNGRLPERVAHAIIQLLNKETADIAVDVHEAPPDRPLVNAISAHERAMDVAALAVMILQGDGIDIRLEASPKDLHGLSHREWGDYTKAQAILMETPSPMHGPIRGKATEKLLLDAKDEFELRAAKMGRVFTSYDETGWPISVRAARHTATIMELAKAFTELHPDRPIVVENMPSYKEISENGIGRYLSVVDEPEPRLMPGWLSFFFNEGHPMWGYGNEKIVNGVILDRSRASSPEPTPSPQPGKAR